MPSPPSRRRHFRPALLSLTLLSACSPHPQTASSIARTERPTLPTLSPELTRTERLTPLAIQPSGVLVSIDKAALIAIEDLLAQAIGAVTRGNNRAAGVKAERHCVRAIFETGAAPAGCPTK